jgi:hypothetical protein
MIDPDGATPHGNVQVTEKVWRDADGKERRVKIVTRGGPEGETHAHRAEAMAGKEHGEHAAMLAEVRAALAEADMALADLPRIIAEAQAEAHAASASAIAAGQPRVIVKQECKPGSEAVSDATTKDGVQIVSICQRRVMASARKGLEEARAEIARDKDIPEDTRKQLLRTLDGQIARWSDKEG